MNTARTSSEVRKTKETDIQLDLNIDGSGVYEVDTGIGFFDHMLEGLDVYKRQEIVRGTHTTEIVIDDRIVEMNFGKAEGMLIKDINEKPENQNLKYCFTIPSKYQAKDGAESYEHIMARAKDFLANELRPLEHTYENVLVVCHGALIRA